MEAPAGHVLVVDDNEMNRDMLSRRLRRHGHTVTVAEGGARALALVEEGAFDLVLLDVMMPDIDGLSVLGRLRERLAPTALPVIMATARDRSEDVVEALKLGANDYVTKPLDFDVVLARVQTQLSLKKAVDQIVALERDVERRAAELHRANERMRRDLRVAARVQRSLLPSAAPAVEGVRFAWAYRPCDELAGDILNVFGLDAEHVGFYMLDVSGHGVPAALLSVTVSRVLAATPDGASLVCRRGAGGNVEAVPPGVVAAELNRRFQMDAHVLQYFTLFYGVLCVRTGHLRYVCAGHPWPVLIRADGGVHQPECPGMAVGWLEEAEFEERVLTLRPGDRLYLYSDGISEAMNGRREQFGAERAARTLAGARAERLDASLESVVRAAEAWCEGAFADDVSALALEVGPER